MLAPTHGRPLRMKKSLNFCQRSKTMTLDLFSNIEDEQSKNRKDKIGQTDIQYIKSASILTEAKGFMGAYDYTLNPETAYYETIF